MSRITFATAAAGVSIEEAPYRLNDLIGYHEVGHMVMWEYGLRQTQSWFDEMLATFASYAFLSDRHVGERGSGMHSCRGTSRIMSSTTGATPIGYG